MAGFVDGHPLPPVPAGSPRERERARLNAARLVVRNGGTADDLRTILSVLDLWPTTDHRP